MNRDSCQMELACASCGAVVVCGLTEMLARLQSIGVLRRGKNPDLDLVLELFTSSTDRMTCGGCGHVGLSAREAAADDWDDWPNSRSCDGCSQPIDAERLEIFPDATLCASCQQRDEAGTKSDGEIEYCPRCGEIMTTKTSGRGGVTRYIMCCPTCRR